MFRKNVIIYFIIAIIIYIQLLCFNWILNPIERWKINWDFYYFLKLNIPTISTIIINIIEGKLLNNENYRIIDKIKFIKDILCIVFLIIEETIVFYWLVISIFLVYPTLPTTLNVIRNIR